MKAHVHVNVIKVGGHQTVERRVREGYRISAGHGCSDTVKHRIYTTQSSVYRREDPKTNNKQNEENVHGASLR